MNLNKIYEYRFSEVNLKKKVETWKILSGFLYKKTGKPDVIIDLACGFCEFINTFPAKEKWGVDINPSFLERFAADDIIKIPGNCMEINLPENFFDAVFISNLLEHLNSNEDVFTLIERMFKVLKKNGLIVIMGPNYKYAYKQYFDFADHKVILTHSGLSEILYIAGFQIKEKHPRFLPLSFKGKLPVNSFLVTLYLKIPFLWHLFGKQFLIIAQK